MKKFYYLKTCKTCDRIRKELDLGKDVELREIKSAPITESEVDSLAKKAGSFEVIFSKRARKYRSYGLHEQKLTDGDFKKYLLEDYTFLKRPLLETDSEAIAGNSKKQVAAMAEIL